MDILNPQTRIRLSWDDITLTVPVAKTTLKSSWQFIERGRST